MLIGFIPNLILVFAFRPPISVPNFSQIEARICELQRFTQSVRKEEKNKAEFFFRKFDCSYLGNGLRNALQILMWHPFSGGHLHGKFGAIWIRHYGTMDVLHLRVPHFLGPQDIQPCVLIIFCRMLLLMMIMMLHFKIIIQWCD